MFNEKVIEIINSVLPFNDEESKLLAKVIAEELWKSGLVMNSPEAMPEQELNVYTWTAIEDDWYVHSESAVAMNMFDAFIEATEHSPTYHRFVKIKKVPKEEYTEDHKELLEWYKERFKTKDKSKKKCKPKQLPGQLDMFDVIDKENNND